MVLVIGSIPLNHLEGSGPDHPGRVLISSEAAAPTRTGEQMATRTRADTRPSFSGMTHTPNLACFFTGIVQCASCSTLRLQHQQTAQRGGSEINFAAAAQLRTNSTKALIILCLGLLFPRTIFFYQTFGKFCFAYQTLWYKIFPGTNFLANSFSGIKASGFAFGLSQAHEKRSGNTFGHFLFCVR